MELEGQNLPLRVNPCCGYAVDRASDLEEMAAGVWGSGNRVSPGSMGVCLNCGAFLVYRSFEGDSRRATLEDWQALKGSRRGLLRRARRFIVRRGRIDGSQNEGQVGTGVDFGI